jgi:hypothetical protein
MGGRRECECSMRLKQTLLVSDALETELSPPPTAYQGWLFLFFLQSHLSFHCDVRVMKVPL